MSKSGFVYHESLAIDKTLRRLEERWLPPMPDESVHHGYWALDHRSFLDGLQICREALWTTSDESVGRKFIDIGCGLGTDLMLAYLTGWDATGLELHKSYIDAANELMPGVEIIQGDAWTFDRYDEFDVIFSNRLCADDKDQDALEAMMVAKAHSGALVYLGHRVLETPINGKQLAPNIWCV